MKNRNIRYCCVCSKRFEPHPRLAGKQRTCGGADCQKQRRRLNAQIWRAKHPESDDAVYRRIRRRDRRAYRRQYWATHPEARQHHASYMRQWRTSHRLTSMSVRDPYRDTQLKLPVINTYLQVMDVREANRIITAKLLSPHELNAATPA